MLWRNVLEKRQRTSQGLLSHRYCWECLKGFVGAGHMGKFYSLRLLVRTATYVQKKMHNITRTKRLNCLQVDRGVRKLLKDDATDQMVTVVDCQGANSYQVTRHFGLFRRIPACLSEVKGHNEISLAVYHSRYDLSSCYNFYILHLDSWIIMAGYHRREVFSGVELLFTAFN